MNFFNTLFGIQNNNNNIENRANGYSGIGALMFGGSSSYTSEKAMLLSTVYRCVNLIGDSVAMLPLEPYEVDNNGYKKKYIKHSSYHILNCEPNKRMTRYTFIKLLISSMLLRGNAYAYIVRNANGDVEELLYLPSEYISIIPPKHIYDPVEYNVNGFNMKVPAKDMIHLINYTFDGVNGISTLEFAKQTLQLSTDSEEHARNFFSGGCNVGGILSVASMLNDKQKKDIKESWNSAFNTNTGITNGLAVLEGNMTYQPISVPAKDAQLLETRQFNVVDICRFFSVNPILAFDLTHSNYASSEAASLSFLRETLQAILERIELEFRRKLFSEHNNIVVKFDIAELLKTDKSSQSAYFRELVQNGIMTVNEARKQLDLLPIEGGDKNVMQSNMMSFVNVVNNTPTNSAITAGNDTEITKK